MPTLEIASLIELSIAPVFFLVGIGAILQVLTNRLGRAVDRTRALETELTLNPKGQAAVLARGELRMLDRRIIRIHWSISLCTVSALLVCVVIAALFMEEVVQFDVSPVIAVLFIMAMISLIAALIYFLAEIFVAARMLRVRTELLKSTD
ncbi:MAG: DUF2721 domain-containing protein [Pseudomonadota bacterium]